MPAALRHASNFLRFLLLGLCLAQAYPASAAEPLEQPRLLIAVGGKALFYYLPLTIAQQQGYFRDAGLQVQIDDFPGGAKALQALLGGSADLVSGGYEHTISMQAKGQSIRSVVVQGRHAGIVLAMGRDRAAAYHSPKDLKGLRIGVTAPGSSTNIFVSALLAKDGLKPDAVSFVGVGTGAGAVAAMRQKQVDAIAHLDPVISLLEASGDAVPVVDTRTSAGMKYVYGADYAAGVLYARTDFIEHNPRTVQAVTDAMVRALRWLRTASPDQILALIPPEYYGEQKALYRAALVRNLSALSSDGLMTLGAAQNVLTVLKGFDPAVQSAATIDLAATFDNRFAQAAVKKFK